jgi:hypothetical protein
VPARTWWARRSPSGESPAGGLTPDLDSLRFRVTRDAGATTGYAYYSSWPQATENWRSAQSCISLTHLVPLLLNAHASDRALGRGLSLADKLDALHFGGEIGSACGRRSRR